MKQTLEMKHTILTETRLFLPRGQLDSAEAQSEIFRWNLRVL